MLSFHFIKKLLGFISSNVWKTIDLLQNISIAMDTKYLKLVLHYSKSHIIQIFYIYQFFMKLTPFSANKIDGKIVQRKGSISPTILTQMHLFFRVHYF